MPLSTLLLRPPRSPIADVLGGNVGGYDPGMGPEFQTEAAGAYPPPLLQNMQDIGSLVNTMRTANEAATVPPITASIDKNGLLTVGGLKQEDIAGIQQERQMLHQILGSMQMESDRLKAREEQARANPIASVLTTIASNMAQADPNLPGWVRGLGAASAQLNPLPDQLSAQRMALAERQAAVASRSAETQMGVLRLNLESMKAHDEMAQHQLEMAKFLQTRKDVERTAFLSPLNERAKNQVLPSFETFAKGYANRVLGATPEEIASDYEGLEAVQKGSKIQDDEKRAEQRADRIAIATEIAKAVTPIKLEASKELADYRSKISGQLMDKRYRQKESLMLERLDADRLKQIATVDVETRQHLIALDSMEQFVNRLRDFIGERGKLKEYTGQLQGLLTQKMPQWLSEEDRQVLQHLDSVEKKRAIEFGGAGVRGWAPGEDMIRKIGVTMQNSPGAATRIMNEVMKQIELERRSAVAMYPYAPWDKLPDILGGPASPIYQEAARRSRQFFNELSGVSGTYQPQTPTSPPAGQTTEQPIEKSFKNKQTGVNERFRLVNGAWVKVE